MLALCLDVVDEGLPLFQDVAYDLMLDILPVVAQCYFSLHVFHDSNGSSAHTKSTSSKPSDHAMYSASVVPTLTVLPVCENQVIVPPPPALLLLAPVAYCPRISVARVSVHTHVEPAIPVLTVVDVGVMLLLQLLIVHRLRYETQVFLDEGSTQCRDGAGTSQDIRPCHGRTSHDHPHRTRYGFSRIFCISFVVLCPSAFGIDSPPSLIQWWLCWCRIYCRLQLFLPSHQLQLFTHPAASHYSLTGDVQRSS